MSKEMNLTLRLKVNKDGSLSILSDTEKSIGKIEAASDRSASAMERLSKSIARVGHYTAGLAAASLGGSMIKDTVMLADKMTLLDSRVAIATQSFNDHASAMGALKQISLETGSGLEGNITMFARLNKAIESTGRGYQDTLGLTKTLSQAISVSGASASEASSLMIQLSQALSSGVLRGDEFNSVMENGSRVVDALSAATGKSRGELRKMAEEGQLSAELVLKTLQSQAGAIDADAKKIPLTIGKALENLNTQWMSWLDTFNRSSGATATFAASLNGVARNMEMIGNAATVSIAALLSYQAALSTQSIAAYVAGQYQVSAAQRANQLATLQAAASQTAAALETAQANAALLASNRALVAQDIASASAALQLANARLTQAAADRAAAVASANLGQATLALAAAEAARAEKTAALTTLAALGQQQAGIARNLAAAEAAQAGAATASAAAQTNLAGATSLTARAMTGLRAAMGFVAGINPFTAIIAAVGAAATAAWLYRDKLLSIGDASVTVGNYLESAWLLAKNAAQDAMGDMVARFPGLQSSAGAVAQWIGDVFEAAWTGIKTGATALFNAVVGGFVAMGAGIGTAAAGVVEVWKQGFSRIVDMASGVALGIEAAMAGDLSFSAFHDAFSRETLSMQQVAKDTGEAVKNAFKADYAGMAGQAMADFGGKVKEGAKDLQMLDTMMASNEARATALSKSMEKTGKTIDVAGVASKESAKAYAKERDEVAKTIEQLQFEITLTGQNEEQQKRLTDIRQLTSKATAAEAAEIARLIDVKNALIEADQILADGEKLAAKQRQEAVDQFQRLTDKYSAGLNDLKREIDDAQQAFALRIIDENQLKDALDKAGRAYNQQFETSAHHASDVTQKAFERAIENIQDEFAAMFEGMLNGDALNSFEAFADNIKRTLISALSQGMSTGLFNILNGNSGAGNWAALVAGGAVIGGQLAVAMFGKDTSARRYSSAETNTTADVGTGAMKISDMFSRDLGYAYQNQVTIAFNKQVDTFGQAMAAGITNALTHTTLGKFITLAVEDFFHPVINSVKSLATSLGVQLTETATSAGTSAAGSMISTVGTVLSVLGLGYQLFEIASNDAMSTLDKVVNSVYALSDTILVWSLSQLAYGNYIATIVGLIVAAVTNVAASITDILDNGMNMHNLGRLFGGLIGGLLADAIFPAKAPNAWLGTAKDQTTKTGVYDPNRPTYHVDGDQSAWIGEHTPFGKIWVSVQEADLSNQQMTAAFGALLKTVKEVDTHLYDTINRLDAANGQAGQTMAFYNQKLNKGAKFAQNQDMESLDIGVMLKQRYTWITNILGKSATDVGKAVDAWFDVLTGKFIKSSKKNTVMVLSIVDMLAGNLEEFMKLPLSLTKLIGDSVKSVKQGGKPADVANEIMGIVNAFATAKDGLAALGSPVNDERVVAFLSNINAIGYGVQDAGANLVAYATVLKKINGDVSTLGDTLLTLVETKFNTLKQQGFDNTQTTAYFSSFGLFAKLYTEAGVAFNEASLDTVALHIHDLSKQSQSVAKSVVDQAIADAKLSKSSRDAAIATLVKSGKLDAATVAEAEYGVSVQKTTQTVLSAMGFIQQLGFITGNSLGEMGVSAQTWAAAADNVVKVFGSMEEAMKTFDGIAKAFLSPDEYAQYNLDTVNRALSNMQASYPQLAGITDASITAMLKSGESMKTFIDDLAAGNGDLAKITLEFIQLLMQRKTAEEALTSAQQSGVDTATQLLTQLQTALDNAKTGTQSAFTVLQKAVDSERKAITDRYNQSIKVTQSAIDTLSSSVGKLQSLSSSLKSALDRLNPLGQEGETRAMAQAQLTSALAIAKAGGPLPDADSLAKALDVVTQPSEALFADFTDYQRDFFRTAQTLSELSRVTETKLSTEQRQLNVLNAQLEAEKAAYEAEMLRLDNILASAQAQIDAVNGTTVAVMSIADAIGSLTSAIAAQAAAMAALASAKASASNSTVVEQSAADPGAVETAVTTSSTPSKTDWLSSLAKDKAAAEQRIDGLQQVMSTPQWQIGASTKDKALDYMSLNAEKHRIDALSGLMTYISRDVPGFASGGYHAGGVRIVGENGPELEFTGPSRIFSHSQSKQLLNNDELIAEVRQLNAEISQLRAELRAGQAQIAANTKDTSKQLQRWDVDGLPATTTA